MGVHVTHLSSPPLNPELRSLTWPLLAKSLGQSLRLAEDSFSPSSDLDLLPGWGVMTVRGAQISQSWAPCSAAAGPGAGNSALRRPHLVVVGMMTALIPEGGCED